MPPVEQRAAAGRVASNSSVAGGSTSAQGTLMSGAPELVIEVCGASTDYDYGPKLELYRRAGVREYITLDTLHGWLVWRSARRRL